MRRLALIGVLLLALGFPGAASAKMCVRIATVPTAPVAGAPTTIRMTALQLRIVRGRVSPTDKPVPLSAGAQLNVRVTGPDGPSELVRVRRVEGRPSVLEGSFTFDRPGTWTLRWSAWTDRRAEECAGAIRIRVRAR